MDLLTLESSKNAIVPPGVKPFRYVVYHVKEDLATQVIPVFSPLSKGV